MITLTLALLAGIVGAFIGMHLGSKPAMHGSGLHVLVHDRLDLTAVQQQNIAAEEQSFGGRRVEVERRL